jgi:hypothetical protein
MNLNNCAEILVQGRYLGRVGVGVGSRNEAEVFQLDPRSSPMT